MVVDDAGIMRLVLKQMLVRAGYDVVAEVDGGYKAISLYPTYKPDLVTMDIAMPDIDGITAIKEIIKIDPDAKIIICSGMGYTEKVKDAILAGAKTFIAKPPHPDRVIATIKLILGE